MSDSEESDNFDPSNLEEIHDEIEKYKSDPKTAGMFVSGWDDADVDIDPVQNPQENPTTHILWAAENGELDTIKSLIPSNKALIHARDDDGYTPLHRAAYNGHLHVINYLIENGASVTAKTEMGWTPLHSACNWNNYKAAARLLAAGAQPNALSDGGQTPLHLAASISHSKSTLLVLLMRDDVDCHKENQANETPEQLAKGKGIYAPLFQMVVPAVTHIKSLAFTYNPFMREDN